MEVEVRRSARRRRTVSAYERDGCLVVMIPASMSAADEALWVDKMRTKIAASKAKKRSPRNDEQLFSRALKLSDRYLGGAARPSSVRWVTNQNARWGSCSPTDRSIRLSHKLEQMPKWVLDYVLVHELAHLLEANHSRQFWNLVANYPETERARGFLIGWATAKAEPGAPEAAEPDCADPGSS